MCGDSFKMGYDRFIENVASLGVHYTPTLINIATKWFYYGDILEVTTLASVRWK